MKITKRAKALFLALALSAGLAVPASASENLVAVTGVISQEEVSLTISDMTPGSRFRPSSIRGTAYTVSEDFTVVQYPDDRHNNEFSISEARFTVSNFPYCLRKLPDGTYKKEEFLDTEFDMTLDGSVEDYIITDIPRDFWNAFEYVVITEHIYGDMEDPNNYKSYLFHVADGPAPITATPTASTVLVDGKPMEFDAYSIGGNNYFKLRDVASVVSGTGKQFDVSWDGSKNAINLVSGAAYTTVGGELAKGDGTAKNAATCTAVIYKDGVPVTLTAYTIHNNNYFKLRDLGQTFDFDVSWDGANNAIGIDTAASYTAD